MTQKKEQPRLFGIKYSNRDFSKKESWGKNQFNSSFPASLAAFLYSKELKCKYLKLNNKFEVEHSEIPVDTLFGEDPTSEDIFYAFETQYTPYQQLVLGTLPRVDLVTQSKKDKTCLAPIEIKLTALPDHTTCDLNENKYGSELVVRPDTIVYLACSIAEHFVGKLSALNKIFGKKYDTITDWTEGVNVQPFLQKMIDDLNSICLNLLDNQTALVLQPIWKTIGKSPKLAENCLDCFVWSDLAFTRLFIDSTQSDLNKGKTSIPRHSRTTIWLFRMLYDFAQNGQFDHEAIIDSLSYNTKNDKAFAINGKVTHKYMKSQELTKPRVTQIEIKKIILGGGQNLLSPERRFDAIIYNTPKLFD